MADKKDTELDKAINRGKNSKFLVPAFLVVILIGAAATLLDDVCTIRNHLGIPCKSTSTELSPDVKAVLDDRAVVVGNWFDEIISQIEGANKNYFQQNNCSQRLLGGGLDQNEDTSDAANRCDEVAKRTFELMTSFQAYKTNFLTGHDKYLEHLASGNDVAAHEASRAIFDLLEEAKTVLATAIIGFDDNPSADVSYLDGFPDVVLSLRRQLPDFIFERYELCAKEPTERNCSQ